ncbi:NAD-dependent epimerase/dehydratase family protein [Bacillus sp. Au-Bac7]|uniref:NAD-dependent epimerase/dehydratase family protein n=1 Tax=Bacillus sp. Au-Bac7 TaxID=2906458 RepID=UPI001E3F2BE0|nr:NAD-dependent epimerase/dehydratase family protein [Bacillus sp. Au-Bac7]MCE4049256.1 NAD-dependent epimerase/dehydratase family protein [Bacillus sp. Au-Bac7]
MKVVIIGGCGHIGSYLVPKLVKAGNEVINISRGKSKPYKEDYAWNEVKNVVLDRKNDETFAQKIASMDADIVIDLINFTLEDTKNMVEALQATRLTHYLFCSSIWAHGRARSLPVTEDCVKEPLDEYGLEKLKCEQYLQEQYRLKGFPATTIMPGQISGPGWNIISPLGNVNPDTFQRIANGEEIFLPNFGMETLHHVHADDVAQVFMNAITHRNQAIGESFHAVADESMTLFGFATAMYRFFGQEPNIKFLPWEKWCEHVKKEEDISSSYYHLARSGHFSMEKAKRLIDFRPRHTILETVEESVKSYLERNIIKID